MTNHDELQREIEGLENPSGRPPPMSHEENARNMQLIDRARLLTAWESNVRTLKSVIGMLKTARATAYVTIGAAILATIANAAMLYFVQDKIGEGIGYIKENRTIVQETAEASRVRSEAQQVKLDAVADAMVELMRARIAEDEARAKPKDPALQSEAKAAKLSALVTTLEAKREVAPPAEKREAEKQLRELKTLAPQ